MAEETLWHGTSSQWKNATTFVVCLFIALAILIISFIAAQSVQLNAAARFFPILLILPAALAFARYLQTKRKFTS